MIKRVLFFVYNIIPIVGLLAFTGQVVGQTEVTKWQYGKKTAISLTYDDGSSNQFKYAMPIMERMKLPATFFIITGPIIGSVHPPNFIGRPVNEIISETVNIPTNDDNFYERASASLYLGFAGTLPYYNKADDFYESGKKDEAYQIMDSLYKKVRNKNLPAGKDTSMEMLQEKGLSWESVKKYAAKGYEFASHSVSHAHLAILDSANMLYELAKSKDDILKHLGAQYTFSSEVPFGIEDKRVMRFGFPIYKALRNSMPEPFMEEINRGYKAQPGDSKKEYVQWQRGPLSKTPFSLMKSWIDTSLVHDNIWLVLVFHGIDDVGWEPLSHQLLDKYFQIIKLHEDEIWVANFGEVARYIRERMSSKVQVKSNGTNKIIIDLTHSLDKKIYDEPLTIKTYVPNNWKKILVKQGNEKHLVIPRNDVKGNYILYQVNPNKEGVYLSEN